MRRRELLSESKLPTLTLSKSSVSTSWTSGRTTFDVLADGVKYTNDSNVNVTSSQSWATTRLSSGTVTVSYTTTTSTSSTRSATISVSLFGQTKQFTLNQAKGSNGRGTYNGYEYIDFALPSRLKWAVYPVGATKEKGYGNSYQWGAGSATYDSGKTQYYTGTSIASASTYDTAHVVMGGKWRMPTKYEIEELIANTTRSVLQDGVKQVMQITSKKNPNAKIVLSFSGAQGASIGRDGYAHYWSSEQLDSSRAYILYTHYFDATFMLSNGSKSGGNCVIGVFE